MYPRTRIIPIILMAVVIVVSVGGVLAYNYIALQKTSATTVTKTTTITRFSTITVPAGNETVITISTATATVTTTIPVTIIKTVTITSLPPKPPKTTSTTSPQPVTKVRSENFTVGNVQVYTTTTSLNFINTGSVGTKTLMLLKIPRGTNIEKIMSNLKQSITNGLQITSSTVNVDVQQTYDPILVVLLPRGTPCTMYKVIVNDGDASDGKISFTIQKYSTADYCIQVVPQDNLYLGIIALRELQSGHYVVDVTVDYGTNKVQYTLNLAYG